MNKRDGGSIWNRILKSRFWNTCLPRTRVLIGIRIDSLYDIGFSTPADLPLVPGDAVITPDEPASPVLLFRSLQIGCDSFSGTGSVLTVEAAWSMGDHADQDAFYSGLDRELP